MFGSFYPNGFGGFPAGDLFSHRPQRAQRRSQTVDPMASFFGAPRGWDEEAERAEQMRRRRKQQEQAQLRREQQEQEELLRRQKQEQEQLRRQREEQAQLRRQQQLRQRQQQQEQLRRQQEAEAEAEAEDTLPILTREELMRLPPQYRRAYIVQLQQQQREQAARREAKQRRAAYERAVEAERVRAEQAEAARLEKERKLQAIQQQRWAEEEEATPSSPARSASEASSSCPEGDLTPDRVSEDDVGMPAEDVTQMPAETCAPTETCAVDVSDAPTEDNAEVQSCDSESAAPAADVSMAEPTPVAEENVPEPAPAADESMSDASDVEEADEWQEDEQAPPSPTATTAVESSEVSGVDEAAVEQALVQINDIRSNALASAEIWEAQAFTKRTAENKEQVRKARLHYEEGLIQCVLKLDGVATLGNPKIRAARKEAVVHLEGMVTALNEFAKTHDEQ